MREDVYNVLCLYALRTGPHTDPPGLEDPALFREVADALAGITYTDCEDFGYSHRMDETGSAVCMAKVALSRPGLSEGATAMLHVFLAHMSL